MLPSLVFLLFSRFSVSICKEVFCSVLLLILFPRFSDGRGGILLCAVSNTPPALLDNATKSKSINLLSDLRRARRYFVYAVLNTFPTFLNNFSKFQSIDLVSGPHKRKEVCCCIVPPDILVFPALYHFFFT